MSCFMGIDAGTSGVKVIVMSETGKVLGSASEACALITPQPGWAEQNPADWWTACDSAARRAVAQSGRGGDVAAIGLSGQMQGVVLMDRDMEPVGNCLIWLDQRAGAEAEELCGVMPAREMLAITGNYCLPSFWAAKLAWLNKHRPELLEPTEKVLLPKDYLRYRMTGEIACEVSDASLTFLLDLGRRAWSDPMFAATGLPRSLVPERLLESQDVAGLLRDDLAARWGLRPGIPVVAGGGDQPVGGVGSGIVQPGIIGATIGTSGVVFGCCEKPFYDRERRAMYSLCHAVPGLYSFLGCTLGAGGSFRWMRDNLTGGMGYHEMTALAAQAAPGCEGLLFLPYLNGEATPHVDTNARGVFFGLSYRHDLAAMLRSVMEGVVFSLRDTIEILRQSAGLEIHEVRAMGGGAKSALWRQMQADIYNAAVLTMNMEEGPAAGAAILAGTGAGHYASVAEGCEAVLKIETVTEPVPENVRRYDAFYHSYRRLYGDLKDAFAQQARIVADG